MSFASETQGTSWVACALLLCLVAVCAQDPAASCAKPCYVVKDYWPFKTCKAECTPDVCNRGWGAWGSQELCCAPGVAFPEGCSKRPDQCWTIENYQLRTCIQDNRKCLQGYGVWASQAACCAPGAAFPQGCGTDIVRSAQPCWVVDTYFPARLCRQSDTLCTPAANVQSWPSQTACCSSAFSEGCSVSGPQAPCYVVDSYWPLRLCRKETDIAACSRGWGVYQSEAICCSPAVAFPEGCSPRPASVLPLNSTLDSNSTLSVPAASAAIASNAALTAAAGDAALAAIPGQMNMTAPMPVATLPTVTPSAGP